MFDILTRYLYEHKKLTIPGIGIFTLEPKEANADFGSRIIHAPGWDINFLSNKSIVEPGGSGHLSAWIGSHLNLPVPDAQQLFEQFANGLHKKIQAGETISWNGLGTLVQKDEVILFTPQTAAISPFTNVAAQKVIRENASHHSLVGDRETTTAAMREQLLPDEERSAGSKKIMWIVLLVTIAAAAWYFLQNGCNKAATGNGQKVETSQPAATYKLR